MGRSSTGRLMYGYQFQNESWLINETGEYGEPRLDWYDDEGDDTFIEACEKRLLAEVGIIDNPDPSRYFDKGKLIKRHYGVGFVGYGSCDWDGSHILATCDIRASDYGAEIVDLSVLNAQARSENWDGKLARACEVLGITPTQDRPRWILCSSYG